MRKLLIFRTILQLNTQTIQRVTRQYSKQSSLLVILKLYQLQQMYEIKRVRQSRQSNLFINSIKLAVSSQIDLSAIDRMKSLPNKSNLLLAYKRKEKNKIKKKIKTLPSEQEVTKAKVFDTIDWVQEKQVQFLDAHMEFKQYDSQEQQREIYSTHVPNIRAKDIRIKSQKSSVMVINDLESYKLKAKEDRSIIYSQIEKQHKKLEQVNICQRPIMKKQKEYSNRQVKYLPQILRIKNDRLSYKQIILGKSLEISDKTIRHEEKEQKKSNGWHLFSEKQKVAKALSPLKVSKSLDQSLKVNRQDSNLLSCKEPIEAKNKKQGFSNAEKKDLHFSPWSTKKSSFKEIK